MTVRKIKVCGVNTGTYMSFQGIQVMLGDGNNNTITMNPIGATFPCDSWILPRNQIFKTLQLGYDRDGVTYIRAITNASVSFTRGKLKSTDSSTYQEFTDDSVFVGLQGFENTVQVKALGFLRKEPCPYVPVSPVEPVAPVAPVDN